MFGTRQNKSDLVKSIATDKITANVMIADASLTIVYLNQAVIDLLKEAEPEIRKDLPRFSVADLVGSNIDVFHKDPSHQRRMLESLSTTHRATISVGGRTFDLVATPLKDSAGKRRWCGRRMGRCVAAPAKLGVFRKGHRDR
jgi:methyl-accepting chemotaxis protein